MVLPETPGMESSAPAVSDATGNQQQHAMKLESAIRILAGTMVLISLCLAYFVNPHWLWLAAFVGVNLIQSALTGFCPAEIILKKAGVGGGQCCAGRKDSGATA